MFLNAPGFYLAVCLLLWPTSVEGNDSSCRAMNCVRTPSLTSGNCMVTRNCGLPRLTPEQRRILESDEVRTQIDELDLSQPMVMDKRFVELTEGQETQLIECFGDNVLRLRKEHHYPKTRYRRQTGSPCCFPSTSFVQITHVSDVDGRRVELIQMSDFGQQFEDTSVCPSPTLCGGVQCASRDIQVMAMVISLTMVDGDANYQFMWTPITVGSCGATSP